MSRVAFALLALLPLAACTPSLPDPKSAGGEVYAVRCGGCHTAYAPGTLTAAMWDVQIDRMQRLMQSRGVNPLTEQERFLITSYLKAHSANAPAPSGAAS
jgi:mono/diheme cytochrome c family protein